MPVFVWALLAFAAWTFLLFFGSVAVHRWSRRFAGFPVTELATPAWYHRAMRADLNCIESLLVFGAIVFAGLEARVSTPMMDVLALIVIVARIMQSTTHVALQQTPLTAFVRFSFFFLQAVAFLGMIYIVAESALNYQRLGG